MDPHRSGQDVLRCDLCENPGPSMYCDVCHINLCKACVGEHLSDESIEHRVVPFRKRGSTLTCPKHSTKICELHCEKCNGPICSLCVSSGEHEKHKKTDILIHFENKKAEIKEDLQELENNIYLQYQKLASKIPAKETNMKENSLKLKSDIIETGKALHRKIDVLVDKLKSVVNEMDSEHLDVMNKKEQEYTERILEVKQTIDNLKKLHDSNDLSQVNLYKSKNDKFRRLPAEVTVTLPIFPSQKGFEITIDNLFGYVSGFSIKTEEQECILKAPCTVSSPQERPLLAVPRIIVNTYLKSRSCYNISCLNNDQFWTCSHGNVKLYNFQGKLVKSIQTKTEKSPKDITVTKNGDLVYTDLNVNLVKDTEIYEIIHLKGWKPSYLCCSSSGDILVVIDNFDIGTTKVVRYSGSEDKQTVQFDAEGQCLYSVKHIGDITLYIVENKNFDLCMANVHERAIVVINRKGEIRFRYTGVIKPIGITTDSQGRILAADSHKHRIHILDQDGQFLHYIDNCDFVTPWSLSVDNDDKLVVLMTNGIVRKIKYCL